MLTYKLPSDPSARRVYIWRKLKRLGAITIFEAAWVLPDTPRTYEQFQWLTAEIQDMGGDAMFWKVHSELAGQDDRLSAMFSEQVDAVYYNLLNRLDQPDRDLVALAQEYQQIKARDYLQSILGQQVRERLVAARGGEQ